MFPNRQYVGVIIFNCVLTTAFCLIPNTKVLVKHALFGGLLASLLAEVAKWVFSSGSTFSGERFISWAIVLVGAELTRTLA